MVVEVEDGVEPPLPLVAEVVAGQLIVDCKSKHRLHMLFVMVEFLWSVEVLRRWEFSEMNLYGIIEGAVVAEVEEGVEPPLLLVAEVAACQPCLM